MSEWKPISQLAKVRRGASPRPIIDPSYFGGNVGWVRIVDVTRSSRFLRETEQYLSKLGESRSVRVDKGDLVMSICGTIGRPIIIDMAACIHDGFVQLYDIKDADTEYLYYVLQFSEEALIAKGQPGTQVNLNTDLVGKHIIFSPKALEQRKIAKILSTVDNLIEKTQALIDKFQSIKQGMMHDLFTRGVDEHGQLRPSYEEAPHLYKESELGWIPKEWEVRQLGTLFEMKGRIGWRGYTIDDLRESGPLVLGATHISKEHQIDLSKPVYLSKQKYEESPEIKVHKGEILLVKTGNTIGKVALIDFEIGDACINPNTVILRNFSCSGEYLYLLFTGRWFQQKLWDMVAIGAQPSVNQENVKSLKIALPSEGEQRIISSSLLSLLRKIANEKKQVEKHKKFKKGLMQDLLTGKVRVKVDA